MSRASRNASWDSRVKTTRKQDQKLQAAKESVFNLRRLDSDEFQTLAEEFHGRAQTLGIDPKLLHQEFVLQSRYFGLSRVIVLGLETRRKAYPVLCEILEKYEPVAKASGKWSSVYISVSRLTMEFYSTESKLLRGGLGYAEILDVRTDPDLALQLIDADSPRSKKSRV